MLFADFTLARRLEGAEASGGLECARAHARIHPEGGAAAESVAGGYAVFTGVNSPLTQALGLGLNGPVSETELERLEEFFYSRGAPAQIGLCPLADPSLRELVGRRGYRVAEYSNVLVRPLIRGEAFPPLNSGVRVRQANASDETLWVGTVALGFFEHDVPPDVLEIFATLFHMSTSSCFLAWSGSEPMGGGAVARYQGVATLFGASTPPAFRKRGGQTALLHARLVFAAAAGCDLAMVSTLPGGAAQRNVERQGFRVVYTRSKMVRDLRN